MGKIGLIIQREFITRVRKKTFLVMTILGPIFIAGVLFIPAYLATLPQEERTITVLDESLLLKLDKGKKNVKLRYLPPQKFDLESAKEFHRHTDDYALLYIPSSEGGDPDFLARNIQLFRYGDVSVRLESYLADKIERYIQREKFKAEGVDPDIIAQTKTDVKLKTINLEEGIETENASIIKMAIGYISGFFIYIFVFVYGAQVMRGVMEEKSSRIVEIIISSVKPRELMLGKIVGIAGVALVQFLIWVILGGTIYAIAGSVLLNQQIDPAQVAGASQVPVENPQVFEIMRTLGTINFPVILSSFAFYFLVGYLLYASLYAAIASAVDKETDVQQFMLPVSLPIIASILILIRAVDNPDGPLAFWFSLFPFTSPIVMMARIPFGVPVWELILSMTLLVLTFLGMVALAGRIYRVGILRYGQKPTFKDLWKWMLRG